MGLPNKCWPFFIVISLELVFYQGRAFGDGCAIGAMGGQIVPVQNDDVKMVSEKVTIDLSRGVGKAECIFRLRNLTDRELSFKMGFPFQAWADPEAIDYQSKGFRVFSSQKELPSELIFQSKDTLNPPFQALRVWTMYFPPRADRIVKCSYDVAMSGGGSELGEPFPTEDEGFLYVARTGALWKDHIDTADVKIILPWSIDTLSDDSVRSIVTVVPGEDVWEKNIVTWHFEHWKPDTNIEIRRLNYLPVGRDPLSRMQRVQFVRERRQGEYDEGKREYQEQDVLLEIPYPFFLHEEARQLIGQDSILIQRYYVAYLRNEILARRGYRFKDRNWQKLFSEKPWYKPNDRFSMSLLNDIEKKNLDFLARYEKKRGWR